VAIVSPDTRQLTGKDRRTPPAGSVVPSRRSTGPWYVPPHRRPEKRKAGGATLPLTTSSRSICQSSHLREPQEERECHGAELCALAVQDPHKNPQIATASAVRAAPDKAPAAEALRLLDAQGFGPVLVLNQAGVVMGAAYGTPWSLPWQGPRWNR
jgi:hypothetical protein